ncbi:F-box/kelch-repeat protein At3g23880-like [Bidens hawaiensis]|uniref:F-box/kelch-repeat protein At3g23880-like n=1 Tax=Bidens hawaiensis TaxID=980011 RepID=UPI00404A8C4C
MALEHKHQQRSEDEEHPQPSVLTILTEIIVEILCRLPVESVLRCKSVCKSWYSLISDPHFVKSHLAISTTNINRHRLIYSTRTCDMSRYSQNVTCQPVIKIKACNHHDLLYDNSIKGLLELDYPLSVLPNYVDIVGSCNGLLCMDAEGDVRFIWNPSTRKANRLPPSGYIHARPDWHVRLGFGYQESTGDYKVVELSFNNKDKRETFVKIYSSKSGNWKNIGVCPHRYLFYDGFGKFCNGALHWVASKDDGSSSYSWLIVSLDLAKETYGEVLQPVYDAGDKELALGSLKEWLCVFCDYRGIRADVWVMKVYGVKDSWTKLVSVPYSTDPQMERFLMPLCISSDGQCLLKSAGEIYIVYDSKNSSYSEIQSLELFGCREACTLVESLVSPMPAVDLGDI